MGSQMVTNMAVESSNIAKTQGIHCVFVHPASPEGAHFGVHFGPIPGPIFDPTITPPPHRIFNPAGPIRPNFGLEGGGYSLFQ